MNSFKNNWLWVVAIIFLNLASILPITAQDRGHAYVDKKGVLRWPKGKQEITGFGVNYSVPFAHAYRSAERMGIDPKAEIEKDVYHLSRLGFDLYRCHIWDTEISDTFGNLLQNEHLDAFDFLINQLKEKGFNYILTPIAYWGNGWPEPDEDTPGFSGKYGKDNSLSNTDAIKAGQNYLGQFLNHVNPYTGLAYKNDPNVIAFEVSNEPHHRGEAQKVTEFVRGMVDAMKKTGVKKPIFYNTSHGVHFADAYFKGGIQGGTFQWYPTGLGYQKELPGNLLPNASSYKITFDDAFKKYRGAKVVYEFDAADVGRSYMYPAMARSFRTAGIQVATQFAYDPTFLAPYNTEYNTHYLNLNYTPQKAISMMIAGEVFRKVPRHKSYGGYPQNSSFDDFLVDYKRDLSVYNSSEQFYYTNDVETRPRDLDQLTTLAGYGSSPVVQYSGMGAYFLDKLENGLWRLEVMPDAVWVRNPFGRNSPDKTVAVIKWEEHDMTIHLKDLGEGFKVIPINSSNHHQPQVDQSSFRIRPGTYMVEAQDNQTTWQADQKFGTNKLNDFFASPETVENPWLIHQPTSEISEDKDHLIQVVYVGPTEPKEIKLWASGGSPQQSTMQKVGPYKYEATVPASALNPGNLNYYVIVERTDGVFVTYPPNKKGQPFDWDFYDRSPYHTRVVPSEYDINLFNAATDADDLVWRWIRGTGNKPTQNPGEMEFTLNVPQLFRPDNENLNATPIYDYSFKHFVLEKISGRQADLRDKKKLVIKARSLNDKTCKLQVAFVLDDGASYGKIIELRPNMEEHEILLDELRLVRTVTLPRPYPTFLPYYLEHKIEGRFDINRIEALQFSIGPGIASDQLQNQHGLSMVSVSLR